MLDKKYEPINQYKKSTFKDEYSYLYRNNETNGKKLQNYKLIHKQKFHKIVFIYKLFVITVEILFILHVANGIYIIIQIFDKVYLHEFKYK